MSNSSTSGELEVDKILSIIEATIARHAKEMGILKGQLETARERLGVTSTSPISPEGFRENAGAGAELGVTSPSPNSQEGLRFRENAGAGEGKASPPSNSASAPAALSNSAAPVSKGASFVKYLTKTKEVKEKEAKERVDKALKQILNKFTQRYPDLTMALLERNYERTLDKYNEDEFNSVQLRAVIAEKTKRANTQDDIDIEILKVVLNTLLEEDICTKCSRCRKNNCGDRPMYAVAGRPEGHTPCDSCRSLCDFASCSIQGGSRKRSKKSKKTHRRVKKSKNSKKSNRATRKH